MAEAIDLNQFNNDKNFTNSLKLKCDSDDCFEFNPITNVIYLPLAWARKKFKIPLKPNNPASKINITFNTHLNPEQELTKSKVLQVIYNNDKKGSGGGYAIISARPKFGKNTIAIALACEFNCKTLIVVKTDYQANKWIEAIYRFSDAKVQLIKPKITPLDKTADIYVIAAKNILKCNRIIFKSIEFLIVDELHQIITNETTRSLLRIQPRIILGLSASAYRYDSYNDVIPWFFGDMASGESYYHGRVWCA